MYIDNVHLAMWRLSATSVTSAFDTLRTEQNLHYIQNLRFDVHRAAHRNFVSIVIPTRCTNVSNLFYFGLTLYKFRTVFL